MDVVSIPYLYAASLWHGFRRRKLFEDVEVFLLFVGCPRSGHSLVGFLLDAHPNIVLASQKSALKYLKHGFTKRQIFYALLQNSRRVAAIGREWRSYSYHVANQWQGRFERVKVVGDFTGLTRLRRSPALLKALQARLKGAEVRLMHCIRNPYDNISTMKQKSGRSLEETIETYFAMCEAVERIKQQVGDSAVHDLRHEALIADPKGTLKEACAFLRLSSNESYYEDCASIIFKSPHKSRLEIPWDPALVDSVKGRIRHFSFLDGYRFEEPGDELDLLSKDTTKSARNL